jgi:hypothetical protein
LKSELAELLIVREPASSVLLTVRMRLQSVVDLELAYTRQILYPALYLTVPIATEGTSVCFKSQPTVGEIILPSFQNKNRKLGRF